jgi:uncharacterized protein YceK
MKKLMLTMMVLLFLTSCGRVDRWWAGMSGYSTVCVDGVEYLQFVSGVTVKYNSNGTLATCN